MKCCCFWFHSVVTFLPLNLAYNRSALCTQVSDQCLGALVIFGSTFPHEPDAYYTDSFWYSCQPFITFMCRYTIQTINRGVYLFIMLLISVYQSVCPFGPSSFFRFYLTMSFILKSLKIFYENIQGTDNSLCHFQPLFSMDWRLSLLRTTVDFMYFLCLFVWLPAGGNTGGKALSFSIFPFFHAPNLKFVLVFCFWASM